MVKDKRPSIIFLMESKIHKTKLERLKLHLCFQCLFPVDGISRGGGSALLLKVDLPLIIHSYSWRHMNSWVTTQKYNLTGTLTCFYGNP